LKPCPKVQRVCFLGELGHTMDMAWPKSQRKQSFKLSALCTMGQGFIDEENNFVENIYLKVSSRRLFLKRTVYGKCNKMGLFTSHSFDLDPCCV